MPRLVLCSPVRTTPHSQLSLASILSSALLVVTTAASGGCRSTSAGPPAAPPAAAQNDQQQAASVAAAAGKEELEYKPDDPRLRFIKVADVEKGTVGAIAAVTGRIAFDEDHTSRVGSPVSGRVEELLVKPGDRVKKGQPLLTIASPDVEGALADARSASADLSLAERALERSTGLYAERAIAKKELMQAESDVVKARSNLERTHARLQLLGMKRDEHTSRFTLRAPVAGTVVERNVLPGAEVRVDGGTALLTISELANLWAYADIYERDLGVVRAGQEAEVRVISYGARAFPATIAHIGDTVDPQTRTVKVRLNIPNQDGALKPEMFARVTLRVDSGPDVIVVPRAAVLSDGEASVVITEKGDNKFEKRPVEVGPEQDGLVRVIAGLTPGERVVTEGALFIKAELENL